MIQNFGGGELLVIIVLALVVLGPERLPEMARSAGKAIHKLKTMTSGMQGQVQGVMDDPAMQPLRELGELASRPRKKLAQYALEAEADERARVEKVSMDAADANATGSTPAGGSPTAGSSDTTARGGSDDATSSSGEPGTST